MIQAGTRDIAADRFVECSRTLAIIGEDLTGATFAMQVRARKDGGAIHATLTTVGLNPPDQEGVALIYGGTDTIANHIAEGRLPEVPPGYAASDTVALSLLAITIAKPTMVAMPPAPIAGNDVTSLWWDMQITPTGSVADVWFKGRFSVLAGVNE